MKLITQICRILVGVLFIISGFIKANDTIGFSYKLVEYFEIFDMHYFIDYAVAIAMFICIFEIMVGVALLLGAYTRLTMWLLLLMIVFFTILTGYSAITGKVTDCGCFGDAIKLTPVQSFMKDLVLLVLILVLFFYDFYVAPVFNKTITGIGIGISLVVTTFFTVYTYMFLPRIDFLPYKVGNN
ncbi:MAG: MauE/DoxX family redox-associated membrane protein, partial [Bacteroidota bacterium]